MVFILEPSWWEDLTTFVTPVMSDSQRLFYYRSGRFGDLLLETETVASTGRTLRVDGGDGTLSVDLGNTYCAYKLAKVGSILKYDPIMVPLAKLSGVYIGEDASYGECYKGKVYV